MTDYQVLIDFDGVLIDMAPFAYELEGKPKRWGRFFGHTREAKPVPEGAELVAALGRIGWRYSISTTRPEFGPRGMQCKRHVRAWCNANLSEWLPAGIYVRKDGAGAPVEVKCGHFVKTANPKTSCPAVLFVDDEPEVVDALDAAGIPALHIEDLAGLTDADLDSTLRYCISRAIKVHRAP